MEKSLSKLFFICVLIYFKINNASFNNAMAGLFPGGQEYLYYNSDAELKELLKNNCISPKKIPQIISYINNFGKIEVVHGK